MKLSKTIWIAIAAGIFVIALAALGMVSIRQVDEKNRLETQLTSSQSRLQTLQTESISSQQTALEEQLNQTTPESEAVKAKLSQPVTSTAAATAIFDAAKANNLIVTGMTSSSPADEIVAGVTLSAISMTATVEGNVSKMVGFVTGLNRLLKTSAVKSVEITVPELTNGDNTTASIELVVYTYRGE